MKFDPRAKLWTVSLLTTLAVLHPSPAALFAVLVLTFFFAWLVGTSLARLLQKMRYLLPTFASIFAMQLLFNRSGPVLLSYGDWVLLTRGGLHIGLAFFLRMTIILLAAASLSTSSPRDIIQGLVQLKIPYKLAFAVTTALGFIPLLRQEVEDTLTALQLRGVPLRQISWRMKAAAVSNLFFPIVFAAIDKAHELSIALQLRGFSSGKKRTSWRRLEWHWPDTLLASGAFLFFVLFIRLLPQLLI